VNRRRQLEHSHGVFSSIQVFLFELREEQGKVIGIAGRNYATPGKGKGTEYDLNEAGNHPLRIGKRVPAKNLGKGPPDRNFSFFFSTAFKVLTGLKRGNTLALTIIGRSDRNAR
jgi:hypothetical protein